MSTTHMIPVQVGPVRVEALCAFQSRVGSLGTDLLIPCAARLVNTSGVTQYFTAESVVPNHGAQAFTTQTTRVLYPGQAATLPAPPDGQAWLVAIMSRSLVQRVTDEVGWIGLGVLGFAVVGVVDAVKHRKTIYHRIARMF